MVLRHVQKAKLDGAAWAVMPGDVLRACTCTNFVYQGVQSMVGLAAPHRAIVLYGTDNQRWPQVNAHRPWGLMDHDWAGKKSPSGCLHIRLT
jgi:hypothetical protein